MRKITAEMLAEKDARPDQIDRFRERFPTGLDPETVHTAAALGVNTEPEYRRRLEEMLR